MSIGQELLARSESKCELCSSTECLSIYDIPPEADGSAENIILLCPVCLQQIEHPELVDANHWRCLNDSMWSQVPAVQIMAWRMLNRLNDEGWARDLFDMLYLDEDTLARASAAGDGEKEDTTVLHKDSNGAVLQTGDNVTLIKDLNVKGAGFTAKRGSVVRGISLVADTPEHIEGRVNGQRIVILTKFVKKTN